MSDTTNLFIVLGVFTFLYMTFWYFIGDWLGRDDVIDSAWPLGFILIALLTLWLKNGYNWPKILALIFVSIWGFRLFWHLTSRNAGKKENHRYQEIRARFRGNTLLRAYLRIYLLWGLFMLLVSTPVVAVLSSGNDFNSIVALVGFAVWAFGILFETIADKQLQKFKSGKTNADAVMDNGLWKYSRHPHYFGEILAWCGAAIVALAFNEWWAIIGPVAITLLIMRVSGLPQVEKKYAENKTYQNYKKRTSALIPLPPKKPA